MTNPCIFCETTHDSMNWKTVDIGDNRIHWMCSKWYKPSHPEYIPDRIRDERREYAKSIVQPWRAGEPSREFIEAYPKQSQKMFSKKELKTAKRVWSDDATFRNIDKAK